MDSPPVAPSAPPETPDETIRRLTAELHEAHQQQAAMTEILEIINSSPGNLAPVFDAILQKAHTLCGADHGNLWTYDGEFLHPGATRGNPRYAKWLRGRSSVLPTPGTVLERIVRGEDFLHIADAASDQAFCTSAYSREVIELTGARTTLIISLRKDTALLGVIFAYRQEVRPFSEKQIALFKSFAAQAVIAMENARLITETREALEQQTATAEVLQVINSSPGDLVPVFEAMLDRAIRLCEAAHGHLLTYDGECFHPAADSGEPHYIEWARQVSTVRPAPKAPLGRISRGERIVHIADLREEKVYHTDSGFREQVDIRSARSQITVGLLKDNILLGAMIVYRQEVRPFSDKQIALLENFAAQAVIAMENVRLLTETREALEQQTATAEVMQVINSSPGDLAPVFDAILEKARILCAATFGALFLSEEGNFRAAAMRGGTEAWRDRMMQRGFEGSKTPISAPLLAGEAFVHVVDMAQIDHPMAQAAVESVGVRSLLAVPLRKEDALCGIIVASRPEVRPFSDKQIALLQNFAAQAVIAMENARLLTETREALEQQTATTEVLQVINSSPGDLAPVFDAMLEKAVRLCDFAFAALWTYEGSRFRPVALHGMPKPFEEFLREHTPPAFDLLHGNGGPIHIADVMATGLAQRDPVFTRGAQELGRVRTLLLVPLHKDKALLGVFVAYRQEVRPFSDKQIALLQNFAAQAVIAMENARLLTETREALEQQTATAEVLQVINSSPGDLTPVFDSILEKAHSLCGAEYGGLVIHEGEEFRMIAAHGEAHFVEAWRQLGPVRPPRALPRPG